MILTKHDIIAALDEGKVTVTPRPDPKHIGPNSIDLHLANELLVYDAGILDSRTPNKTRKMRIHEHGFVLAPQTLYIARTVEMTHTPYHVPYIGGRSSVGRLGIFIHCTAGFGDVGFQGTWTLEITVVRSVRVYARMRIAQLWLMECSSDLPIEDQYHGRYQGQIDATASKMHER